MSNITPKRSPLSEGNMDMLEINIQHHLGLTRDRRLEIGQDAGNSRSLLEEALYFIKMLRRELKEKSLQSLRNSEGIVKHEKIKSDDPKSPLETIADALEAKGNIEQVARSLRDRASFRSAEPSLRNYLLSAADLLEKSLKKLGGGN